MSKISDVMVKGISLILDGKSPAVPHASTKFAILKTQKQKDEIAKLEQIEKKLRDMSL